MPCIMCGHAAGFNRAILDIRSGQSVGRLCRNCELTYFGRRLGRQDAESDTCVFCQREGYFALPTFVATVVESGGELISKNVPQVVDTTPQICEYHVDLMEQFDEETEGLDAVDPGSEGRLDNESP